MSRLASVALLVLAAGCAAAPGDCASDESCDGAALRAGSFKLSPTSATVTTTPGTAPAAAATRLTDSTKKGHGFAVTCTGGAKATPASGTVSSTTPASISVQAPAPQAAGTSSVTCQLASTSGSTSNAVFKLKVVAAGAGGFSLSLTPSSPTLSAGSSASVAVSTAGSGQIALSLSGLPSSVTSAFSPSSVAAGQGSTLTLTAAAGAVAGTTPFQVTGTSGAVTHAVPGKVTVTSTATPGLRTVWLVLLENHSWSQLKGSASAPYLNGTLLSLGAHAEQYFNPPRLHPSEPNYLWLEAGTNFGVLNDGLPSANHQATTQHLATLLEQKGLSWRSYQEGITGTGCPVTNAGLYAPKHNPFVFFDDIATTARCAKNVRPYAELAQDLAADRVASYNFVTPDLCHDMHNASGCATTDAVKNGDTWLSQAIPPILASAAYQRGGAVFITWDESENGDHPIGMIVLSPQAKAGYASSVAFTHSSMLRTAQEIFGVTPLLGDAVNATDLGDLFRSFP